MVPNIVVYTAVSRSYDYLKPVPPLWAAEADFLAFTDTGSRHLGWQVRPLDVLSSDPCRNAKLPKILPHQYVDNYEFSVWIDGSIAIISEMRLSDLLAVWLSTHDIAVFPHHSRNCIYDEAIACIKQKKDSPLVIRRQMDHYLHAGYGRHKGLAECTVIARRRSPAMRLLSVAWHHEIDRFSRRDQLSFNVVCEWNGISYYKIPGSVSHNAHFVRYPHTPGAIG